MAQWGFINDKQIYQQEPVLSAAVLQKSNPDRW